MSKFKNLKKGIIITMGVCMCVAFSACGCSDSKKEETKKEEAATPSKEPINKDAPTKVQTKDGKYLDLQLKPVDKVNESDYVAILNKGKANGHFSFTVGSAVKKVALCEAKSENGTKFEPGDEIDSKENLGENEKVCIDVDIKEGKPNKMLVITCSDDSTQKCLISYNGQDSGAILVPLQDK